MCVKCCKGGDSICFYGNRVSYQPSLASSFLSCSQFLNIFWLHEGCALKIVRTEKT